MIKNLSLTDTGIKHIGKVLGLYINRVGTTEIVSRLHNRYSKIIGQAYTTGNPLKPKHHTYNIETNKEYETLKNILEWHIRLSNSKHTKEIYDVID
jgi:deferrochelatase/peroxidase EfeB